MTFDAGENMEGVVCYVDDWGQLICTVSDVAPKFGEAEPAIKTALGRASSARMKLIMKVIEEIMQARITDASIANRTDAVAQSVHVLLQKPDPVMLLYRYRKLPGNVMAAYYVQQNKFDDARAALEEWGDAKPDRSVNE